MTGAHFKMISKAALFSTVALVLTESILFLTSYFFQHAITAVIFSFLLFLVPITHFFWLIDRGEKNRTGNLYIINKVLWSWFSERENKLPELLSRTKRFSSILAFLISSIIFGPLITLVFIRGLISNRSRGLLLTVTSNLLFVTSWVVIYRSGILYTKHLWAS